MKKIRKFLIDKIAKKYGRVGNYLFYRCKTCQGVVSGKDIENGGCKCGGRNVSPSNLSVFEELRIIAGAFL